MEFGRLRGIRSTPRNSVESDAAAATWTYERARPRYTAIYDRLDANGIVGIFPEGGSHDRASLLPLKAGIAVMALGACQRHGEALRSRLRVVAVGLNYFSGHRFRSRVFVDYGEPFEVSAELVQRYASGDKRGAGDALMAEILTAIKAVTVFCRRGRRAAATPR